MPHVLQLVVLVLRLHCFRCCFWYCCGYGYCYCHADSHATATATATAAATTSSPSRHWYSRFSYFCQHSLPFALAKSCDCHDCFLGPAFGNFAHTVPVSCTSGQPSARPQSSDRFLGRAGAGGATMSRNCEEAAPSLFQRLYFGF